MAFLGKEAATDVGVRFLLIQIHYVVADVLGEAGVTWWQEGWWGGTPGVTRGADPEGRGGQ